MQPRIVTLAGIIIFAAVYRILPHPPNIAPIAAMALFSGTYFKDIKLAFIVPLLSLLLSDLILGFHSTMLSVYTGMSLAVVIGLVLKQKPKTLINLVLASASATAVFFLLTNFGAWLANPVYEKNGFGLLTAYFAGIPFLHYSLIGDMAFTILFFKLYQWLRQEWNHPGYSV